MKHEDFYDRSRAFAQVVGALGGPALRIALRIDPALANSPTAQLLAAAACELLPRISERYTIVAIEAPADQEVVIPRAPAGNLSQHLLSILGNACPRGRFQAAEKLLTEFDYEIIIGSVPKGEAKRTIYVWSSGWRCFASMLGPIETLRTSAKVANPFACLATAALAAMMMYHDGEGLDVFLHAKEIVGWSLFDLAITSDDGPPLPDNINVGRVVQAGIGGTGNALLWALQHGPELSGDWEGYEHEVLDETNGNRYLLMHASDTGTKAALAQLRFGSVHPRLNFEVTPNRVETHNAGLLDANLVLATVDDPQIRVNLQRMGAPVILNVGTNSQWLSLSLHELRLIREGGPCVECFYGANQQAMRRQRESTVSFVVALVGALLGAEFVKHYCFPENALANSWLANVFSTTAGGTILRPSMPECQTCGALRQ